MAFSWRYWLWYFFPRPSKYAFSFEPATEWEQRFTGVNHRPSYTGCIPRKPQSPAQHPALLPEQLQGYLAHETPPSCRTLQQPYAEGPMVILGGVAFLVGEVPLRGLIHGLRFWDYDVGITILVKS